jgi:hypothetical protein
MRRGFFGEENVNAFVLLVGEEDLLFVVAALGVDLPGVEFGAWMRVFAISSGDFHGIHDMDFQPF